MNGESGNAQDARVEALWKKLDVDGRGYLDADSLRRGLQKLDHPLKNANDLLGDILRNIDSNRDGQISFTEFRSFVKQTERELWSLFESIDRNHDGHVVKEELQAAFQTAGLTVSSAKLDHFFDRIDTDHDGDISFEEWRNFLLFIPTSTPDLEAVLSYYTTTVRLSPEGDVVLADDSIQGLGNSVLNFLKPFFGALIQIAQPLPPLSSQVSRVPDYYPTIPDEEEDRMSLEEISHLHDLANSLDDHAEQLHGDWKEWKNLKPVLISCVPSPGYFIAGGAAGAISRTATAPLDRLKVYLIAQTGVAQKSLEAAKHGALIHALKGAWRTSANATKELWAAGGLRSLYAGNGLNIIKIMPESAIKFGTYEASKRVCASIEGHNNPKHNSAASKFISGGISGMASQFCVYPLDTLKFRMQCETVSGGLHGNQLIFATAKKMWSETGFRAFYRGLPMGLIGMFPYAAIDLGTFEYLKRAITLRNARLRKCHEDDAAPSSFSTALIGGFSGALGASIVYPLNLLRTRLQSQGTVLHPRTYTGIMDVFQQTIKGEGFNGLFKGLTPNLLKVVPAVSITYVVYENAKKQLNLK